MKIAPDQCIMRFGQIYQQKLHQQLLEKRKLSNTSKAWSSLEKPTLELSTDVPVPHSSETVSIGPSPLPSSTLTDQEVSGKKRNSCTYNSEKQAFLDCVLRHNFEWISIGRELNQNPYWCRKLYITHFSQNLKSEEILDSPPFPSGLATEEEEPPTDTQLEESLHTPAFIPTSPTKLFSEYGQDALESAFASAFLKVQPKQNQES